MTVPSSEPPLLLPSPAASSPDPAAPRPTGAVVEDVTAHPCRAPADDDVSPIDDPFLMPPPPQPRMRTSRLAIASVLAPLAAPVGSIAAIVLGWEARREIMRSGSQVTGKRLALAGMVFGALMIVASGALLSMMLLRSRTLPTRPPPVTVILRRDVPPANDAPIQKPRRLSPPAVTAPKQTTAWTEGQIDIVDIGVEELSLERALAKQRAAAAKSGESVLVMLTGGRCEPCRGVDESLKSSLMQTALDKVRLVRVDLDVFGDDLDKLKMPHDRYPAFFLLGVDLTPKDGIDGGEWDDDVAQNIAPVLGAFVRGKYTTRRNMWTPPPGAGISL